MSVQNVLRVLECKLEDMDASAWSLHRWTPGGNVPTLRSVVTSAGQRHDSGCDTHAPPNQIVFLHRTISPASALIKTRSSAENTMFIVYANYWLRQHNATYWQLTAVTLYWKPRYFVIGIWTLITPLSNNTFSWNFFSQIHSKTSARNFIRLHSDLAFLSHIV